MEMALFGWESLMSNIFLGRDMTKFHGFFFSDGNRKPWNKQPDMLSFLGVVIIVNHPRSLWMGLSSMVDFHGQVSLKWRDGSYSGEKPQ